MTAKNDRPTARARAARHAENTAPVAIDVRDLSFTYAGAKNPVLAGVGWQVPQGAFALLVGGTGSGKSTLLSLLKREIAPAGVVSGQVSLLGTPQDELTDTQSATRIGYVFQNPDNQIVCESVWHEMAFGLENLGAPQDHMRRLVAETSYFFGMESWFRAATDELSGGRKQLLALASTLVMKPRLLLLDEPTSQLDPIAEKNFLHALFRVNRELGCTVVVATHAPQAMVDYATCAFELVDGQVRELADLDSLRVRPQLLAEAEAPVGARGNAGENRDGKDEHHRGQNKTGAMGGADRDVAAARTASLETPQSPQGALQKTGNISAAPWAKRPKKHGYSQEHQNQAAPALSLSRAWFRYDRDGDWVLRNLDLTVAPARIHALVGGNGCGKSTLLGLVAGTRRLARGKLTLGEGRDSRALLPQDPKALFACEHVDEELLEWSRVGGYAKPQVDEMLAAIGLAGRARLHPYDLSGGQQQLLALGKLMLTRPRLLILDEPTKGLDAAYRAAVARMLTAARNEGAAVLTATHDLDFVSQVADDVSMMFDGEIACTQPREEFFDGNVYYRP